ncbi:MAG: undecaprenyl-diphosphatase UppP [bacterium]|nr:undecaprenyl-diphosphatase UppP [bacterium]
MTIFDAIILGLVQGLTEFLPVSSSGHLVIGQHLLNMREPNLAFDVVVHLGTLLAVIVYFWGDIQKILFSLREGGDPRWRWVCLLVVVGTIPTGFIGVLFKDVFEEMFASVRVVSFTLIVTGLLLFMADRVRRADRPLSAMKSMDALVIGLIQGLAIVPGISRSGSTIATGLFLKIDADAAARFSFLLSIPAIMGAVTLQSKAIFGHALNGSGATFLAGFLTAAVSGWLAIKLLMAVLKKKRLTLFSIYCWFLAAVLFVWVK